MGDDAVTRELVGQAQAGDERARDELMRRALPQLHAYVRMRMGARVRSHDESFDIVQSACREVIADLSQFEYSGPGAFRHWLATAALRKIVDRADYWSARKRDAAREAPVDPNLSADPVGQLADVYASFATPSRLLIGKETVARIESALAKLPDDYREAIYLSRVIGLSRHEVAEQMGRSEASVRNLVSRALALLAEDLTRSD